MTILNSRWPVFRGCLRCHLRPRNKGQSPADIYQEFINAVKKGCRPCHCAEARSIQKPTPSYHTSITTSPRYPPPSSSLSYLPLLEKGCPLSILYMSACPGQNSRKRTPFKRVESLSRNMLRSRRSKLRVPCALRY